MSKPPQLTRILTNDLVPIDSHTAPRPEIPRKFTKRRDDPKGVIREENSDDPEDKVEGKGRTKAKGRPRGLTAEDLIEDVPKNNLLLVIPALGLVAFVSALDQTIISTALPVIASELNASPSEYSWVGTSYLLAQTLMTPINGRLTDIIGRKPALYAAISTMIVFSILCATAKTIKWLIIARAFAGLGGGSIVGMTLIVLSDIVPLAQRARFQGYMGCAWGSASVIGPVLGGIFTSKLTWRWCFWINLPTCGASMILLMLTLNLHPAKGYTWKMFRQNFDFLGLLLVIMGAGLLIIGFSFAADDGFGTPHAYGLIIPAVVVLGLAFAHCLTTKRQAVIPARMLRLRTTLFFCTSSFFQSFMFLPTNFLLPQFFQGVRGASVLDSGLMLIPFCVTSAVVGIFAGEFQTRTHSIRPIIWVGFGITSLGYFLMYACYTSNISFGTQEGLQVLTSGGAGLSFSTPLLVIQSALSTQDMAAGTSGWILVRSMGATVGLACLQAISNAGLRSRFSKIPGYGTEFQLPTSAASYKAIHDMPAGPLRDRLLAAFADSIRTCFALGGAMLACALFLTLFTKNYSMNRFHQRPSTDTHAPEDPEKGEDEEDEGRHSRVGERTLVEGECALQAADVAEEVAVSKAQREEENERD